MVSVDDIGEACLNIDGLIVCVKDNDGNVIGQNAASRELCGELLCQQCDRGCTDIYEKDESQQWKDWGSRTYRNCKISGLYFDLTIISSSRQVVTILQSLEQKYQQAYEYYSKFGLGARELQVIKLVIAGLSNNQISERLFISTTTLRTHLKNIYNKVKGSGGSVEFLPFERKYDVSQIKNNPSPS
ncbi:MAG: hypothetical protein CMM74_07275 [Rhodospirillaceae bacterium]|nr:hypothetical protein [Rhodospirillaceae bacterium]